MSHKKELLRGLWVSMDWSLFSHPEAHQPSPAKPVLPKGSTRVLCVCVKGGAIGT